MPIRIERKSHRRSNKLAAFIGLYCSTGRRLPLGEGQTALAENLLKKAIEVIEKQRSSIKTQTGRIGLVGDKQTACTELIDLLLAYGRYPEAFAYVERAKARAG